MGRKNGKGGGQQQQLGPVSEASRVRIARILEEFQASQDEVYTFEPGLSKQERALIHMMCRKMGMVSRSSGYGERRQLSVYKSKRKNRSLKKEEVNAGLQLSEETKNIIQDLFMRYPPDDTDLSEDAAPNSKANAAKRQWKPDTSFCRPSMGKSDIQQKMDELASKISNSTHLTKVVEDRAKLPIASFKHLITSTLENNQVVLISGETGCGKTTQVPQYLLEYMWDKGETCKIVCTQPRRISAISVAERISYERGETVGETVGYRIRLESKGGKQSSIMFCTNGVLLRLLISRGSSMSSTDSGNSLLEDCFQGITHVIVDEIHERDRFSDFMLTILRDLLPSYPHIRLVLMSATIDAERFSNYFYGCPIIQVPGFTYPVTVFYLEDVLSILKSMDDNHLNHAAVDSDESSPLSEEYRNSLDEAVTLALTNEEFDPLLELISSEQTQRIYNYRHSSTGVSPLMVFAGKGKVGDVCMLLSYGADCSLSDNNGRCALDWAECENQIQVYEIIKKHMEKDNSKSVEEEKLLNEYLACINPEHIDTLLIERLLRKICTDSTEGAILIFLPGWDDINQTREKLVASSFFQDESKFLILSLHSMIPSAEQKKVFKCPPIGIRKIILSTNIAETAVTIDDVVYVIDSGRMKEKNYDPYNNVSTLHSSWVSKASARQREGRAGRCQPGTCYHLFSKFRAVSLPEYQVPEIKRMPIEELCLQVKLLDPNCKVADFLQKTLDPPVSETIRNAIIVLQDIGALMNDEKLTDLGEKLGSLPVHPSTSKMLLFAILMNCLDPALTLACAADYREPFLLPVAPDERKKAALAKLELASLYGGYSDQLAVVAAFDCWKKAKGRGLESQFCSRYYISSSTMNMLFSMRKQLQSELAKHGFIPQNVSSCSVNAHDPGILRAVLVAGAYPMIGRLLPRRKNDKRAIVETAGGAKARLHPHSSNFDFSLRKQAECPLVLYDEITRGDGGMYIRNCSLVGPYPLLFLAVEMVVAPTSGPDDSDEDVDDSGDEEDEMEQLVSSSHGEEIMSSPENNVSVVIDGWLRLESTALDVAQIYCLRERLFSAILFKAKNPQAVLPPALGASVYAIACILSCDGLPSALADAPPYRQQSPRDKVDMNKSIQGKRQGGFIQPGGFLRSLISDNVRTANVHIVRNAKHSSHMQSYSQPQVSPISTFPGANSSSSTPRIRSFKRHR
ncbi:DExH-box ATP-dependent RNA helicase DExH6-like [Zingiber officinale]|uniref:DExH-box ATP-dependent RNA helicase DExH6-like n=1 Tax=Zingiber officinale TaxID=94328 RepID=UPI001C4B5D21|nr:DExH-box ATP-dependent RNA helicase DExH6-like [Zingiber officinale]XP_042453375.1 DExH-box ATP-dependent RNA helicase DExH6-like [Zingiber officinale]XP_042453376.1 DExH-box ATP-dependent RNA helicase DExH6-like [Zingiber officinale]